MNQDMLDHESDLDEHTVAVQQLFVKHQGVLRGFLVGLVPDFDAVDDIIQEVFLVITRRAETFELGSNFTAWACEIGKRKAMEYAKSKHMRLKLLSPEAMSALSLACPYEDKTESLSQELEDCVSRLAPKAQEIIRKRYSENIKPGKIAEEMEWTPQAVYVSLTRSRHFLRDCLTQKKQHALST